MTDAGVDAEEVAQWQALFPTGPVARLIAALRASQAEVERLTAEIAKRDRIVARAFRVDL